jgi:hypothetical protein
VDILGNLLHIQVHAANISDTKAACDVFERTSEKYPSINAYSGDAGYRGTAAVLLEAVWLNFKHILQPLILSLQFLSYFQM